MMIILTSDYHDNILTSDYRDNILTSDYHDNMLTSDISIFYRLDTDEYLKADKRNYHKLAPKIDALGFTQVNKINRKVNSP